MTTRKLIAAVFTLWQVTVPAIALDPLSFEEISLLLRIGESPATIIKELDKRKLLRPLSPRQAETLKASGASEVLLNELQRPDRLAPPDVADAVELRQRKHQESQKAPPAFPAQTPELPKQEITPPLPSPAPAPIGDKELRIEKIVILKDPLHQPFHVFFKVSANAGRTEASYHVPGKKYKREGVEPQVEIPVNLVLKGVQENDWATVSLHLDPNGETVKTFGALKRHTARIPIVDKPLYAEPFEFDPPRATFIVSLNSKQEFVYQVYWKIQ